MQVASRIITKNRMFKRLKTIQSAQAKMKATKKLDVNKQVIVSFQLTLGVFSWPYKHQQSEALPNTMLPVTMQTGFDDLTTLVPVN